MTQEEKDLLLKDLSARLSYGVICEDEYGNVLELNSIDKPNIVTFKYSDNTFWTTDLDKCKPYLFPLSSMTEEQKVIYTDLCYKVIYNSKGLISSDVMEYVNWCYKNHIDINNLIPMGLAIDVTNLNIY